MAIPSRARRMVRAAAFAWLLCVFTGCGGGPASSQAIMTPEPARLQIGDLDVQASTAPLRALPADVLRRYGIAASDHGVLLLVTVRRAERSVPARVSAFVTDLRGERRALPMRALLVEGYQDHLSVVEVEPPETLRFDVRIAIDGQPPAELRFSRDFAL